MRLIDANEKAVHNTYKVSLLNYPTEDDWMLCKRCALVTVGKEPIHAPDATWKHAILRARHSPIRTLMFAFLLENIPYYVSVHLARHVHAQPFIRSQRNDRQSSYDRNAARQDVPVDMVWVMNAEEFMTIASKRLCRLADKTTREVVRMICALVVEQCPEFNGLLAPPCELTGRCTEMYPCGKEGT